MTISLAHFPWDIAISESVEPDQDGVERCGLSLSFIPLPSLKTTTIAVPIQSNVHFLPERARMADRDIITSSCRKAESVAAGD